MIAILKYNAGNVASVANAIERLGYPVCVTEDEDELRHAQKIIFPGVGEAASAMHYLRVRQLDKLIPQLQQPVLGICLGMQLLCRYSEEGDTLCLGVFNADVKKIPANDLVPHMGWNNCTQASGALFNSIAPDADLYFVHSYYAELNESTVAVANYVLPFSAAMQKNNFYAVQFHPERSATAGSQLLKNFLAL